MVGSIEVVLFDWGGTLMVEFPEYAGPMAEWPRVEAVPGASEALNWLFGKARLGVVTNAANSGEPLVRTALKRVALDRFFEVIATPRESGKRKPDPEFFLWALDKLHCMPGAAVMVGDSYPGDIEGAKSAGLRAVWLNPSRSLSGISHPAYDAEISTLMDLPEMLENLRLPDLAACYALLDRYQAPSPLVAHSQAVAGAAYRMAGWLRAKGELVDPLLAHRGGLLHDLDKLASRQAGRVHGEMSAEILTDLGWPDLGEIARRHLMDNLVALDPTSITWEQKLVFYADKLVEGSQLVPVQTRLAALRERYPNYAQKIAASEPKVIALEQEISTALGQTPAQLLEALKSNSG